MIKFKSVKIRGDVDRLIKDTAEHLGFYDPRFPEEDQCTGYHAFKEMCLMNDLCSMTDFTEYEKNPNFHNEKPPPGFYLISKIHPVGRSMCVDLAKQIKGYIVQGKAGKIRIKVG